MPDLVVDVPPRAFGDPVRCHKYPAADYRTTGDGAQGDGEGPELREPVLRAIDMLRGINLTATEARALAGIITLGDRG